MTEYRLRAKPPKLTKAEALELEKRNALVLEHLDWAHGIARNVAKCLPTWFVPDDLLGPAEIALCHLADKYDPSRGVPFRAFAQLRLYGACFDSVRRKEYRERGHLELRIVDRSPNPHERPAGTWRSWAHTGESMEPSDGGSAAEALEKAQSGIFRYVWNLPTRHQRIIVMRYLLDIPVDEIGRQMNLSAPRISQLHGEAITMLRGAIERAEAHPIKYSEEWEIRLKHKASKIMEKK
jgi:RNA polymerase sigma factor for flagellar operon FliA